jgi:hypothetical protein
MDRAGDMSSAVREVRRLAREPVPDVRTGRRALFRCGQLAGEAAANSLTQMTAICQQGAVMA